MTTGFVFCIYMHKMSGVDYTITRFSIGLKTNGHHCSYADLHKMSRLDTTFVRFSRGLIIPEMNLVWVVKL